VHPTADVAVIKSAYRTIMRELQAHPDLGGDEEQAKVVNEAHRVLTDPDLRTAYDATRRAADRAADNYPARYTMGIGDLTHAAVIGAEGQETIVRSGSWGYAGLPYIYLIAHRAWWHLLANLVGAAIPVVNIGVYLWYLFNAKRLVGSTRKFDGFDQYRAVQEAWDRVGMWVLVVGLVVLIISISR